MTLHDEWIEELSYCLGLLARRGDELVGTSTAAVASYLRSQRARAKRTGPPGSELEDCLGTAASMVEVGQWSGAHGILDRVAIELAGRM